MSPTVNKLFYELKCPTITFVFVEMTLFGAVKPKTIFNTAYTYRSSSVSRFSMTSIEGLRFLLDMATVDKTDKS